MCPDLTIFDYILRGGLALLGLYIAGRLLSAAYFNSKRYYDKQRTHHG